MLNYFLHNIGHEKFYNCGNDGDGYKDESDDDVNGDVDGVDDGTTTTTLMTMMMMTMMMMMMMIHFVYPLFCRYDIDNYKQSAKLSTQVSEHFLNLKVWPLL